ncbi:MAG: C40 family peptidase [Bacteroidales bacterium]
MEKSDKSTAVSIQGYVPVMKEPRERSEMVTQVLFGEHMEVLDDEGQWIYVKSLLDHYEGWLDKKCVEYTTEAVNLPNIVVHNAFKINNINSGHQVILPMGSLLPEPENGKFFLAGNEFVVNEAAGYCKPGDLPVSELFGELLSIPYLWGGKCGFGFDCSGLTQFLCRVAGKEIPRDAAEQSAIGETLSFISEAKAGDLAFFDNAEGMIHHVGMVVENNRIIHASGAVRIDRIDQQGIFNGKLGRYTYKLRVVKRIT